MLVACLILGIILHGTRGTTYGPTTGQIWPRSTGTRFNLDISGAGLSASDTIRLIQPGHSCTEDSGNVASADSTIDWHCPDISTGCTPVRVAPPIDIPVFTMQWNCIYLNDYNTCPGAVGITQVSVDGNTGIVRLTFDGPVPIAPGSLIKLGTRIQCGATCTDAQLNLLRGGTTDDSSTAFYIGNTVIISDSDPPGTIQIRLPSFAVQPAPQFVMDPSFTVIDWYRTDVASTRVELKGLLQRSQINVCWNGQGRPNGYTTSAGIVNIVDPGVMANVGLYPVTVAPVSGAVPVILAFTTSSSTHYSNTLGIGGIVIRVVNSDLLRIVTIAGSDLAVELTPSQDLCASLFSELWSSDEERGFPLPKSCWTDVFSNSADIHVTFNKGNGLQRNTDYQMVFNVVMDNQAISGCTSNCAYIVIDTVADSIHAPFVAIESATAQFVDRVPVWFSASGVFPSLGPETSVRGGVNGIVDFANGNVLTLSLSAGLIQPGNIVRVIFAPFTQLKLNSVCSAAIVLLPGDVGYTGPLPECSGTALVPGSQLNVIQLRLPSNMNAVTYPGRIAIAISGLVAPSTGFFSAPVSIEISEGSGSLHPFYFTIPSALLSKNPDSSVGRIVNQLSLTDFTYAGDTGVQLYVNIMTGISVSPGMTFSVYLPNDWECLGVSNPTGQEYFWSSIEYPTGRGTLESAVWTFNDYECSTSVNLYAETQIFLKISANVPSLPVIAGDGMFSVGISDGSNMYTFPFSTDSPSFVSSVSVLGTLTAFHIEPVDVWTWTLSKPGIPSQGVFGLFFTPQQTVANSGYIRVSLPEGFVPVSPCTGSNLFDYIYAIQENAVNSVNMVPGLVGSCTFSSPFVWIQFQGTLKGGTKYAFGLGLVVPMNFPSSLVWQIRTADQYQQLVDGVHSNSVPLIPGVTDSYGPYLKSALLQATVADYTPYSLTGLGTTVTLTFFNQVPFASPVNGRLTIPSGFVISGPISTNGVNWAYSHTSVSNVVVFSSGIQLSAASSYTITVPVEVPDRPPVETLFKFRIEFGFDSIASSGRLLVVDSDGSHVGPVRGLDQAIIEPLNLIAGQLNTIRIQFQTHAVIPVGGKITIAVPSGFEFPTLCSILLSRIDLQCAFAASTSTVALTSAHTIPAGMFSFYIEGSNPTSPSSNVGLNFVISTFTAANTLLEVPVSVPSFAVTASMGAAGFVNTVGVSRTWFDGRDDRPNHHNSFIVFFTPTSPPTGLLTIRAPQGFLFDPNCLSDITVDPTEVFGSGIPWPPGYQIWPQSIFFSSCIGSENFAYLTLSESGLPVPSLPYAIRVGVQSNPPVVNQVDSQWQILIDNSQASVPFETFPLWTFGPGSSVTALQKGAGGLNIATVTVFAFSTIASGGSVEIAVPSTFTIHPDACNYLVVSGGSGSATFDCYSTQSTISLSIVSGEGLVSGQWTSFSIAVVNPSLTGSVAEGWTVQSFASSEFPRDLSILSSFSIIESPEIFQITGYLSEGGISIPALRINTQWALDIDQGTASVQISAPGDLWFATNGAVCLNAIVKLNNVAIPPASIQLICTLGTLTVSFLDFMVPRNTLISVILSVTNGLTTPNPNFFIASLITDSTGIVAQGAMAGWTIVPQLTSVAVNLVGPLYAAGSVSSVEISFTASEAFDEIDLVFVGDFALPPEDNGYSIAITDVKGVSEPAYTFSTAVLSIKNEVIIALNRPVNPASTLALTLNGITLSHLPGPVIVSIVTSRAGVVSNSRIRFPAFVLPGISHVVSQFLQSRQQEFALSKLAVNSQLASFILPVTGDSARLSFTCFFDLDLPSQTYISVSNPFYDFTDSSSNFETSQILHALQKIVILANVRLPDSIADGQSNFIITSSDSPTVGWPSNTNDALTPGFTIVYPISLVLQVQRAPPTAQIQVELVLSNIGPVRTFSLILVAPQGYGFPENCLSLASIPEVTCSPGAVYDSVLSSATISFSNGIINTALPSITLLVNAPVANPLNDAWFIIAQDVTGSQTGWGLVLSPFAIQPMANVAVHYPALENVKSQVSFSFSNAIHVRAGATLQVQFPSGFIFDCSTFRKVTMPYYPIDAPTACSLSTSISAFDLAIIQDLVPGTFSFTVSATSPAAAGAPEFSMIIYDANSNVLDSNIGFSSGGAIRSSSDPEYINVQAMPGNSALIWSPSPVQGGSVAVVEVRFQVVQQISIQSNGFTSLAAIRISFPQSFVSAVQLASDVIDTSDTPITSSVDLSFKDGILIIMDNTRMIATGDYGFKFPVFVPWTIPDVNIWFISFCSSKSACASPNDASVIASLPLGGFAIGEVNALSLSQTMSGSSHRADSILSFAALVFVVLLN